MRTNVYQGPSEPEVPSAHVLIVEDEAIARRALARLLRSSGYSATMAASGEEALQRLADHDETTVAVVDLDLPGMNGLEFIARMRCTHPRVAPILVTATGTDRLAMFLSSHPVDYLRKPFDYAHLLHLISHAQQAG